jgi:hypothetical protein
MVADVRCAAPGGVMASGWCVGRGAFTVLYAPRFVTAVEISKFTRAGVRLAWQPLSIVGWETATDRDHGSGAAAITQSPTVQSRFVDCFNSKPSSISLSLHLSCRRRQQQLSRACAVQAEGSP